MYFLNFALRIQHHYLRESLNTHLLLKSLLTLVRNRFLTV